MYPIHILSLLALTGTALGSQDKGLKEIKSDTYNILGLGTDDGPSTRVSDYFAIVNDWRSRLNNPLGPLELDGTLENNALITAQEWDEKGHQLLPGSFAQVQAPAGPDDFENALVGGWLCEVPSLLPDGTCDGFPGWIHDGTQHAEILTGGYTRIGCSNANNYWVCDLA
ncbi:hypothetical protein CC79DRAFT_1373071 [Sarocladium strictum]